jgi:outer membrane protein, heavy metal efflux system
LRVTSSSSRDRRCSLLSLLLVAGALAADNAGWAQSSRLKLVPVQQPAPGRSPSTAVAPAPRLHSPPAFPGVQNAIPCPAPVPAVLSLVELENLALARNPTLAQAQALVREEEGLMRQVGRYPNPTLGYVRTDNDSSGQSRTNGVFVSQEFVTAGKLGLNQSIERQEIQNRLWQLNAQRERVLNDVRIRFSAALGAQEQVRQAERVQALAEESVKAVRRLFQAKQVSQSDVLQAEIQEQAVLSALDVARSRAQAAWQHLVAVVGAPELPPIPLQGRLEANLPPLDWQTSLQKLLEASPLLRAQQALIQAGQYGVQRARVEPIPNVTVQMVAEHDYAQKANSVSTLVALPVPLFNRNQGNITNAEGHLQQQVKEYERIQLALTDQFAGTFQEYQTARSQFERLRDGILPRARQNLDLTTRAYRAGQIGVLNLLAAQQTYFQSSTGYLDALTELHRLTIEIDGLLLTGGLNPTEIGTALQAAGVGGAGIRNVLLRSLQEQSSKSRNLLPGAIQAGGP